MRIPIYLIMLLVAGELIVGLDKLYIPLGNEQQIRMKIDIRKTEEFQLLANGNLPIRNNDIRVMILGDSYVYGGGVDYQQCVATRLRRLLAEKMTNGRRSYVLDLSRPSNNTLDNYNTLVHFIDRYKPTHVLWAYNINDILGPLTLPAETTDKLDSVNTEVKVDLVPAARKGKTSLRAFVDGVYRMLPSIEYFSYKTQTLLRGYGIILPIGDFHYLVSSAYKQTSTPWNSTTELLTAAARRTEISGTSLFMVYILPEYNLLEKPDLFASVHYAFSKLRARSPHLTAVDGYRDYQSFDVNDLMLSKYDGHPSGRAHEIMANRWYNLILSTDEPQLIE